MADEHELRRRAQPMLDRPPYEALPVDELRARAAGRARPARRRLVAAVCALVVIAGAVGAVVVDHARSNDDVAVRTTDTGPRVTAPPITVPAGTSVNDLRFKEIAGPAGGTLVYLDAVGDQFLAVGIDQYDAVQRLWIGDPAGRWRAIAVPAALRGTQGDVVAEPVGARVVVLTTGKRGRPIVLAGPSLDALEETNWTSDRSPLPAAIHPAPPPGRGITVSGSPETTAVGDSGIVIVGRVTAGLNLDLLPQSIRDKYTHEPGRIDVRNGRVIVTNSSNVFFNGSARALGLTAAEIEYLSLPDDSHSEIAVWGAAWGKPVRQLSAAGIDQFTRYGNFGLTRVADGFVMDAPSSAANELWWSRDGQKWRKLTPAPREVMGLIDLGSRWVIPSAGVVSDDHGRSWIPIDIGGQLASHPGAPPLLGVSGTSEFGLLGASTPLNASLVKTFAGRLLYSPDGRHWTSADLDQTLGFSANIPSIAVGSRSAILESGLRAPGVQRQRFWLVSLNAR